MQHLLLGTGLGQCIRCTPAVRMAGSSCCGLSIMTDGTSSALRIQCSDSLLLNGASHDSVAQLEDKPSLCPFRGISNQGDLML